MKYSSRLVDLGTVRSLGIGVIFPLKSFNIVLNLAVLCGNCLKNFKLVFLENKKKLTFSSSSEFAENMFFEISY